MNKSHNTESNTYRYAAFISYNSNDEKWAKWLQRKLENYRLPVVIRKNTEYSHKRIGKCFIYHNDILPEVLMDEIKRNLDSSRWLIVICSPSSAQSDWVGDEINMFIELGRKNRIIPFIIDGIPYTEEKSMECYHRILHTHFPHSNNPHETQEILGANINESSHSLLYIHKQKAFVKVVARIIGVEFDTLWRRHRRQLFLKIATYIVFLLTFTLAIWCTWFYNQPFDSRIKVFVPNDTKNLEPIKGVSICSIIDGDTISYNLVSLSDEFVIHNIPSRVKGKQIFFSLSHPYCLNIDTSIVASETIDIPIYRDPYMFGHIDVTILNASGSPIVNANIKLLGSNYKTDNNGRLLLDIPLHKQLKNYIIHHENLTGTIHMPTIQTDLIVLK